MIHKGVRHIRNIKRIVRNKKKIIFYLIIALVLFGLYFGYSGVFGSVSCENFSCFKENMKKCSEANYVNEAPEASWGYGILGTDNGECLVSVKLLQAKKGDLGMEKFEGFEMECSYPRGIGEYPEKDLSKCHGRLKEEMQGIIIKKLHTVIIENLGVIDSGLNS